MGKFQRKWLPVGHSGLYICKNPILFYIHGPDILH